MGNVYLALAGRPGLEKLCVVKRLPPEDAGNGDRVARFRREAEIASRLSHGAIAQTLAVDEVEGEPFIVQEYLEGRTVTQVLSAAQSAGQRMPIPLVVHIVREVARALAYAHRLDGGGVVHRDVSPHNIMLTFAGEVRLIDFGIARGVGDPSLTQAGVLIGKQSYMAPELFRGQTADRRADTYSLGVVLWELLSGQPFSGSEKRNVPRPSSLVGPASVPLELDAVAVKALAARPEDRYQTGEELQRALGSFLPSGFVGETAVAEFMRSCYDVETLRRHLAEDVAEGKPLLEARTEQRASVTTQPLRRTRAPLVAAGLVAAAAVVVGALALVLRSRELAAPATAAPRIEALPVPNVPQIPEVIAREPPHTVPAETKAAIAPPAPIAPGAARPALRARARGTSSAVDALLDDAHDSLQIGELAGAERDARQAIKEGTPVQKARAHTIIGQVFVLRSQPKNAEAEFEQAIHLDPSNKTAGQALTALKHGTGER
jgi:hypothetical protein